MLTLVIFGLSLTFSFRIKKYMVLECAFRIFSAKTLAISVQFQRTNIPQNLQSSTPANPLDISSWGNPVASYPSTSCNMSQFFGPQQLVIDITLCVGVVEPYSPLHRFEFLYHFRGFGQASHRCTPKLVLQNHQTTHHLQIHHVPGRRVIQTMSQAPGHHVSTRLISKYLTFGPILPVNLVRLQCRCQLVWEGALRTVLRPLRLVLQANLQLSFRMEVLLSFSPTRRFPTAMVETSVLGNYS